MTLLALLLAVPAYPACAADVPVTEALASLPISLPWGTTLGPEFVRLRPGRRARVRSQRVEYLRRGDPRHFFGVPVQFIRYTAVDGRLRMARIVVSLAHASTFEKALVRELGPVDPEYHDLPDWYGPGDVTGAFYYRPQVGQDYAYLDLVDLQWELIRRGLR